MAQTTDRIHIDENDPKFQQIETGRQNEIADVTNTFNGMMSQTDAFTNQQIEAVKQNEQTQIKNQNEMTDFTIEKLEQEKQLAEKDFQKEQSAAYVDFQKESNRFGVNAEKMAQNGFFSSGYSESSQVAMYNQYQNRVAVAREGFNKAVMNYNNSMQEARLQNNVLLAEIASKSLEEQLTIAMKGFQSKNQLIGQLISQKNTINQRYDSLWQNTYSNLLKEEQINEEARRYEESRADAEKDDALALVMELIAAGGTPTAEQIAAAGLTQADVDTFIADYQKGEFDKNKAAAQAEITTFINAGGTIENGQITPEMIEAAGWSEEQVKQLILNHNDQIIKEGQEVAFNRVITIISAGGTLEGGQITDEMLKAAGISREEAQLFIDDYDKGIKKQDQQSADAKIEQLLSLGITPSDALIAQSSWTPEEINEMLKKTTIEEDEWTDKDGNPVAHKPTSFDYSLLSDVCGSVSNYEDSAEALNNLGLIEAYVDGETGKFKLNFSAWTLKNDGGGYVGTLNDNMTVESPDGRLYSISELYDKLKDVMGSNAAKNFLAQLQGYMKNNSTK